MTDGVRASTEQELADLVELLDAVGTRIDALDGAPRAGSSAAAEENRAIGGARAHLARQHAGQVLSDLDEVRRRAQGMTERARALRARRRPGQEPAGKPAVGGAREATALRAAARDLVDVHDRDEVVRRVLVGARRVVPGARWTGVVLGDAAGRPSLEVGDSAVVDELTAVAHRLGRGPMSDVLAGGDAVAADLAADGRWPGFADAAAERGVCGVLVVALPSTRVTGALVLYADRPRAFGAAPLRVASTYADHVGIALGSARRVAGMARALETRDVIGQAKGIVAQRDRIDPEAAFEKLVSASQRANLKVAEVARWVVAEQARREVSPEDGVRPVPRR